MTIPFWKYQGAGNDFIMIDQRSRVYLEKTDRERIAFLCDRHFGIGADGLILLQKHPEADFEMVYFNADGRESSMCGNGGRCIVAFAYDNGMERDMYRFIAIDGEHEACISQELPDGAFWVELKMNDVAKIELDGPAYVLDTGSPHYVRFVPTLEGVNMFQEGQNVRYNETYREKGINVNLAVAGDTGLQLRTYERGVEAETLACGTGITATALAHAVQRQLPPGPYEIPVQALGGKLSVRFLRLPDGGFSDIWLCGPAKAVFQGGVES